MWNFAFIHRKNKLSFTYSCPKSMNRTQTIMSIEDIMKTQNLNLNLYHPFEEKWISSPPFTVDKLYLPEDVLDVNLENYYKVLVKDEFIFTRFTDLIYKNQRPLTLYCSSSLLPETSTMMNLMTQLEERKLICLHKNKLIEQALKKVRIEIYDDEIPNMFYLLRFKEYISQDLCIPFVLNEKEEKYILVKTN